MTLKTRAQLNADADADLADNTAGDISPADVRLIVKDVVDSYSIIGGELGLAASVAANALTIALKGADGNDPSSDNPVTIPFRNVTLGTGTPSVLAVTAATSLVISSGSTLAFANATAGRLWIVAFDDGGTLRLGAVNCRSGSADILGLRDDTLWSSTAEGGAGGADSAHVIYTGSAVTTKAICILGYLEWAAGLTTAGAWDAAPTKVQLLEPGISLPGAPVQRVRVETGAVATTTTTMPNDDTIPQSGEGGEFLTKAITPRSAANTLIISFSGLFAPPLDTYVTAALFQDSNTDALAAVAERQLEEMIVVLQHGMRAGTASSTTFKIRAGAAAAGTLTFNGVGGARRLGGVGSSYMEILEYMG